MPKAGSKTRKKTSKQAKQGGQGKSIPALVMELNSALRRVNAALETELARYKQLEQFAPLLELQPKALKALLESARQMKRRPGRPAASK